MAPPVFFVGTLVEVDNMKTDYIVEIDDTDNSFLFLKLFIQQRVNKKNK